MGGAGVTEADVHWNTQKYVKYSSAVNSCASCVRVAG